MVQMLTGIYYGFYNGEWDAARRAVDDVLYRAQLELYPEPLLVANAIKASLPQGALKSTKEGTRCIQVEITPTSARISRNAVTSMSIRGHRWKRHDAVDLTAQEELSEVYEMAGDPCSRTPSKTSQTALYQNSNNSSTGSKPPLAKSQRRSGGFKAGLRDKEAASESSREQLARKQAHRAMSENLELLTLKRSTLTTSYSLPKPGSNSLAHAATSVFSKSFEQVSGITAKNSPANTSGSAGAENGGIASETNRFSACSLQEEKLMYISERTELLLPSKQQLNQQRPPRICITLSND